MLGRSLTAKALAISPELTKSALPDLILSSSRFQLEIKSTPSDLPSDISSPRPTSNAAIFHLRRLFVPPMAAELAAGLPAERAATPPLTSSSPAAPLPRPRPPAAASPSPRPRPPTPASPLLGTDGGAAQVLGGAAQVLGADGGAEATERGEPAAPVSRLPFASPPAPAMSRELMVLITASGSSW